MLKISPRVQGELLEVAVSDNEVVEPGALLAEIDPTPFRLAVAAAEADLESVGQSIGASTAEVAAAQAKLAEAEAVLDQQPRPGRAHADAGGARRGAGGAGRRGDRVGRLGRGGGGRRRGRPAPRRGGAGTGGREQPAASRGAVGAGDRAVQPDPDADRGADARPRHQLQPRTRRDGVAGAAAALDDRPAGRLDRRLVPREPARERGGGRGGGGRARRLSRAGLAGAGGVVRRRHQYREPGARRRAGWSTSRRRTPG